MSLDHFRNHSVTFKKNGESIDRDVARVLAQQHQQTQPNAFTDLLILSHGWNNNAQQARDLYNRLLGSLKQVASQQNPPLSQSLAVLALHWPSKQFDFERRRESGSGGAASSNAVGRAADHARVIAALEDLHDLADHDNDHNSIDLAISMVPQLEDLRSARDAFVATLLPLLTDVDADSDPGDAPDALLTNLTGREVLDKLDRPAPANLARLARDDAGGAAGGIGAGAQRGAFSFVNLLTFWKMKKRAGTIGGHGVARLLNQIGDALPEVRMHLVGHSFGARLVTAAAMAANDTLSIRSLILLQGAFSHHGFSPDLRGNQDSPRAGAFRSVIAEDRIKGPIIATHTRNDRAVGLAYPMAARLSRDDAAALGDADSRFGGIGSNGAVRTPEADNLELGPVGTHYSFRAGQIANLQADRFIEGHSDVAGPEVAAMLMAALNAVKQPTEPSP